MTRILKPKFCIELTLIRVHFEYRLNRFAIMSQSGQKKFNLGGRGELGSCRTRGARSWGTKMSRMSRGSSGESQKQERRLARDLDGG